MREQERKTIRRLNHPKYTLDYLDKYLNSGKYDKSLEAAEAMGFYEAVKSSIALLDNEFQRGYEFGYDKGYDEGYDDGQIDERAKIKMK